jgi:hypothetical protein
MAFECWRSPALPTRPALLSRESAIQFPCGCPRALVTAQAATPLDKPKATAAANIQGTDSKEPCPSFHLSVHIISRALQSPSRHNRIPPKSVPASKTHKQHQRRYTIEMHNTEQHMQTSKCAIRGVLLLPCPFKPLLRDDEE